MKDAPDDKKETLYLLKSLKNAKQLLEAISDFKEGKNFTKIVI